MPAFRPVALASALVLSSAAAVAEEVDLEPAERLARSGPPPVEISGEKDGAGMVALRGGCMLTTFVTGGDKWRCDSTFAK